MTIIYINIYTSRRKPKLLSSKAKRGKVGQYLPTKI